MTSFVSKRQCEGDAEDLTRELGGARLSRGVVPPTEGKFGGIVILWNPFEVEEVVLDRQVSR